MKVGMSALARDLDHEGVICRILDMPSNKNADHVRGQWWVGAVIRVHSRISATRSD